MGRWSQLVDRFLGRPDDWQFAKDRPFGTLFWGGTSLADRVKLTGLRTAVFSLIFRPIVTSYHANITQDRISSAGWDAWDEFWTQQAGVDFGGFGAVLANIFLFFQNRNSIDAGVIVTDTDVNTTSQATHTHTCPANSADKVVFASSRNNTEVAPVYAIVYTPNGGTSATVGPVTGVQSVSCALLGGGVNDFAGNGPEQGIRGPLWMQVGDTLIMENTNFDPGDVRNDLFIFERYTLT